VLVFRRPPSTAKKTKNTEKASPERNRRVWFYEVKNDGYDPDKIAGGGRPETPEQNDIPQLLKLWKKYKDSNYAKPPGVETGTLLGPENEEPKCWWAEVKTIAEYDYNLAAGRYKPQVAEKVPEEDPVKLIHEVLAIEREITERMEKLLKEVES